MIKTNSSLFQRGWQCFVSIFHLHDEENNVWSLSKQTIQAHYKWKQDIPKLGNTSGIFSSGYGKRDTSCATGIEQTAIFDRVAKFIPPTSDISCTFVLILDICNTALPTIRYPKPSWISYSKILCTGRKNNQYSKIASRQPRSFPLRHRNGWSLEACLASDHETAFGVASRLATPQLTPEKML